MTLEQLWEYAQTHTDGWELDGISERDVVL